MPRRMLASLLLQVLCALFLTTRAAAFDCGNGLQEPGEECDDGNHLDGDGCSATCLLELCNSLTGTWYAGGVTGFFLEAADSAVGALLVPNPHDAIHTIALTGTLSGATVNLLPLLTGNLGRCSLMLIGGIVPLSLQKVSSDLCGDGVLTSGEECDDGNWVNGDGCDALCLVERCGNAVLDVDEECDDGNGTNGDACDVNCTSPRCGNYVVDPGEQCDDGNTTGGDGCDEHCGIPGCPNGVVDPGEECDDGNITDNDGCARNCRLQGCGNFIVEVGEECDDGNLLDGDGCDSNCTLTRCGNGIATGSEQCDSGTATGDCCSAACQIEPAGGACADDGDPCTADQCGSSGVCTHAAIPDCAVSTTTSTSTSTTTSLPAGSCVDSDGDGEIDSRDRCPDTPPHTEVDDGGCSLVQFCASFDVTVRAGARACKKADWKNDEPVMPSRQRDCTIERGGHGTLDDRCIPSAP